MTIEAELHKLHNDLAELYRGKSTDILQIKRLWLRINELESEEDLAVYGDESEEYEEFLKENPIPKIKKS